MKSTRPLRAAAASACVGFALVAPGCGKAFSNGCWDTLTCSQGADGGVGGEESRGGSSTGGKASTDAGEPSTLAGGGSGGTPSTGSAGNTTGAGVPGAGGTAGLAGGQAGESGYAGAAGAAGRCTNDEPCEPSNPCKYGRTVCGSDGPTCEETTNHSPGSWCGAPQQCSAGMLTAPDACDTNGKCVKGKPTPCSPFSCNSTSDDCDSTRAVPCGTSMCAVQNQSCCYFPESKIGACINADQKCEGYPDLVQLWCKSKADCNQGEVCCGIFANYSSELSCMDPKLCTPNGQPVAAIQFCDPKTQAECDLGSCVPFNNSTQFPAYNSSFPADLCACSTK